MGPFDLALGLPRVTRPGAHRAPDQTRSTPDYANIAGGCPGHAKL